MLHARLIACLLLVAALPAAAQTAPPWTVTEASALRFTAQQQGAPVEGGFAEFTAAITFDPEALAASTIEVEIATASVATGHKDRDATLRSAAFFAVEEWPTARFASSEIVASGDGQYEASGELTIRDVTRPVVLPFTLAIAPHPDDPAVEQASAEGELAINRLDYGVGQGEWASTKTIADEVVITVAIEAERPR